MKKSKQALSAFAWLLAAVLLLAAVMLALPPLTQKAEEAYLEAVGGMELGGQAEGDAIALVSSEIPREQFEAYGVSPAAESAISVQATLMSSEGGVMDEELASKIPLTWTLAWSAGDEEDISEYITVQPGEDTRQATVTCLQPFNHKATLTVALRDGPMTQVSIPIDYREKFSYLTVEMKFGENSLTVYSCTYDSRSSNLIFIDNPFGYPLYSDNLQKSEGTIVITVYGEGGKYTLPMECDVGRIYVQSGMVAAERAAGLEPLEDPYALTDGLNDRYFLIQMLGLHMSALGSLENDWAALKQVIKEDVGPHPLAMYTLPDMKVNGEPYKGKGSSWNLYINASSLDDVVSDIELDKSSLVF